MSAKSSTFSTYHKTCSGARVCLAGRPERRNTSRRLGTNLGENPRGLIMDRRAFLTTTVACAASVSAPAALAQLGSGQPARLIIPLQAGGATDPYGRLIAEHMARTLARPIIVEHKPGGSGIVGH